MKHEPRIQKSTLDAIAALQREWASETAQGAVEAPTYQAMTPSPDSKAEPEWTYSRYRATLKRNGEFFAIVTSDGRDRIDGKAEAELLAALNAPDADKARLEQFLALVMHNLDGMARGQLWQEYRTKFPGSYEKCKAAAIDAGPSSAPAATEEEAVRSLLKMFSVPSHIIDQTCKVVSTLERDLAASRAEVEEWREVFKAWKPIGQELVPKDVHASLKIRWENSIADNEQLRADRDRLKAECDRYKKEADDAHSLFQAEIKRNGQLKAECEELRSQREPARKYLREALGEAADYSTLPEAVALLVSQRDNAYNERDSLRAEVAELESAQVEMRRALERIGNAPDSECYLAGGIARAALAAARDNEEQP